MTEKQDINLERKFQYFLLKNRIIIKIKFKNKKGKKSYNYLQNV